MHTIHYSTIPGNLAEIAPNNYKWLTTFVENKDRIEAWLAESFAAHPPPLYASVDLRFAGYKLAPVDTNLFPAGFNNLCTHDYPAATAAIKNILTQFNLPTKWLLLPENHTRNLAYWANIRVIQQLFIAAGCDIRVGTLLPEVTAKTTINLAHGDYVDLYPVITGTQGLMLDDFQPDVILLNNDLAEGVPTILKNTSQPVLPSLQAGWYQRRKSMHACFYDKVIEQFAALLKIDPWQLKAIGMAQENIDFDQSDTQQLLANNTANLFTQINQYYANYNIKQPAFVMLKADAGTYGQAVMSVTAPEALTQLTRSQKQSMRFTKGKRAVNSVLLQEGVYTIESFSENHATAEPVIYLINGQAIGGFYRINAKQTDHDNLNKPGMHFAPFSLTELLRNTHATDHARCYAYTVIARLAVLAAAKEIKELTT
jgi:glutamate--cysteine ligase